MRSALAVVPRTMAVLGVCLAVCGAPRAWAEPPSPALTSVFPAGAHAGTTVELTVAGSALEGLAGIRFGHPGFVARKLEGNKFSVAISGQTPPGSYDVRAFGTHGVSSPRTFVVGNRAERLEVEPNETVETAESVVLDVVINGRIEKPGDIDCFRFTAKAGQRVVLECRAERIDSQLRGILELYDAHGSRIATNRGAVGVDPLIDFLVPADGEYVVKLFDLTFSGGANHFYRLDIDTGPRVEFSVPAVVQRGKTTRVALYGRNLRTQSATVPAAPATATTGGSIAVTPATSAPAAAPGPVTARSSVLSFDRVEVDVTVPNGDPDRTGLRLRSTQLAVDALAYQYPGGHAPLMLSVTDLPVVPDLPDNHTSATPQELTIPCEVGGQLAVGDEQDWFVVQARRGDVLWLEALGQQIGSPVDLDLVILEGTSTATTRQLAHFSDVLDNPAGDRFPLSHLDPAGRWVAPADGRYLLMLRNLVGGLSEDPRRVYRLSVRREEPDFQLSVVSRKEQPAAFNVERGGRELLEVLAVRRRALTGPIRISASNLPAGIECPDVWIGPGADRAALILSAGPESAVSNGTFKLQGRADVGGVELIRQVRGGTMIWPNALVGSARLTDEIPVATTSSAPLFMTASLGNDFNDKSTLFQDGILDLSITLEPRPGAETGVVTISAVGLPPSIRNEIATIPAGQRQGWISFYLPATLPVGPYTFVLQAETETSVLVNGKPVKTAATVFSNPVTIQVEQSRIALGVTTRGPTKIARGKIVQLGFTAERKHGFIGKVHVDISAAGGLAGLRARGVTLVGKSDSGSLQVIANEDAPLGRQPFLRLEAVGTVEDKPIYHTARFVELEITE